MPIYEDQECYDTQGNVYWRGKCSIKEVEKTFSSRESKRKDAKKDAYYKMLMYVLNNM